MSYSAQKKIFAIETFNLTAFKCDLRLQVELLRKMYKK